MNSPFIDGMYFYISVSARKINGTCKSLNLDLILSYGTYYIKSGKDDYLEIDGDNCYPRISAFTNQSTVLIVNQLLKELGCDHTLVLNKRRPIIRYGV